MSSSEDSSDSESEEQMTTKTPVVQGESSDSSDSEDAKEEPKAVAKKDDDSSSDSDSDSEEENTAPVKKATPIVTPAEEDDSSSDSSDDEEEKPPQKAATPASKDSDSDDSSSDEEEEEEKKALPKQAENKDDSDSDSSSDEEEEEEKKAEPKQAANEDDSDSDSSSDEEDVAEKAAPKAAPKPAANDSDSDSDSSSDEEDVAEKKAAPKAAPKPAANESDSDSSSDDEEEEKPAAKTPAVAANDDDSDSDSDEDEKPVAKPAEKKSEQKSEETQMPELEADEEPDHMPQNIEGSFDLLGSLQKMTGKPRKRKLENATLPVAKKQSVSIAKATSSNADTAKATSSPAASSSDDSKADGKSMKPTKEYHPHDFRTPELKDETDTVFVKGIDINAFEKDIDEFFTEHVAKPVSIRHKWEESRPGLAWVTFATKEQATKAVIDCNNEYIKSRYVNLDWAKGQTKKSFGGSGPRNANLKGTTNRVWIGNLHREVEDENLIELFKDTAAPTDVFIIGRDETKPKMAYCSFESNEIASTIIETFQGTHLMDNTMRLDWAEARRDTGGRGSKRKQELSEKQEGCLTCFVGRLSDGVDDDKLVELFKDAGEITNIRYMERDGEFKGVAFVEFAVTESTDKAVQLNGTSFLGKAIRVDFAAERKKSFGGDRAPDWDCEACGATGVFGSRSTCFKCDAPKPANAKASTGNGGRAPDWDCPACGATGVFGSRSTCFKCDAPKPAN